MPLFTRKDLQQVKLAKSLSDEIFEKSAENILFECFESSSRKLLLSNYDIFLCHSYWDADEILKLSELIRSRGYSVFVDWQYEEFQNRSSVSKTTANKLRRIMRKSKSLVYAFSTNAKSSRWMPWEMGYFDGLKGKVAILPVSDILKENYKGIEFLGLYPFIKKQIVRFVSNTKPKLVTPNSTNYIVVADNDQTSLKEWINTNELSK